MSAKCFKCGQVLRGEWAFKKDAPTNIMCYACADNTPGLKIYTSSTGYATSAKPKFEGYFCHSRCKYLNGPYYKKCSLTENCFEYCELSTISDERLWRHGVKVIDSLKDMVVRTRFCYRTFTGDSPSVELDRCTLDEQTNS